MSDAGPLLDRDACRARLLKYTRRAWDMLPPLPEPRILDIGCGSGLPTIELARWSGGDVVGLDVDPAALDCLMARARREGLEGRVRAKLGSLFEVDLPEGMFDIVWSEGALAEIGFLGALRGWRRLLRPGGYLVVHDDASGLERKLQAVAGLGYELVGHFRLPEDAWWVDYYSPLQQQVRELVNADPEDQAASARWEAVQAEIDRCAAHPGEFGSAFIVMRKV